MDHRELIERGVDAIQRRDAEAYAQLFAEDAVVRHPLAAAPLEGRAAIREAEQALFDAFSEIDIEMLTLLSSGRTTAVEVMLRATHTGPVDLGEGEVLPATQRRVEIPAVWMFEVGPDGLVVTERDYFDTAAFMRQLGLDL